MNAYIAIATLPESSRPANMRLANWMFAREFTAEVRGGKIVDCLSQAAKNLDFANAKITKKIAELPTGHDYTARQWLALVDAAEKSKNPHASHLAKMWNKFHYPATLNALINIADSDMWMAMYSTKAA